jgi:hemolysin D
MVERHGAARLQWLEAEQERTATRDSVSIEQERALQAKASKARVQAELKQYQADTQREILAKLVEARDTITKTELDIERYRERERHRYLRAPVNGTVQELQIRTVGGVVQPAQALMTIVPDDAPLAVDAKVLNQDIGFVKPGQPVRLKVDSFPYTKYGILNGTVIHLSPDATPDEKLGPVYTARIHLDNETITARGNRLPVQAGMAVTAEIKTDNRRVIDYLLSPIKEVVSEAFKER